MRKLTEQDLTAIVGTAHKGYIIKMARVKQGNFSDSDHYGIVLGVDEEDRCVTWQFHLVDEKPEYYWGHYIDNKGDALVDYRARA